MKLQIMILLCFKLTTLINAQSNLSDSSITLVKIIAEQYKYIGEHGVDYIEKNKPLNNSKLANDFKLIVRQANINKKNYNFSLIKTGKHTIKLFEGVNEKTNPYRIVEIMTVDSSIHKKIPKKIYNYLILSKLKPKIIEILVDEDQVGSYKIDKREIGCIRESVIYIDDDFDDSAFLEVKLIMRNYKKKIN